MHGYEGCLEGPPQCVQNPQWCLDAQLVLIRAPSRYLEAPPVCTVPTTESKNVSLHIPSASCSDPCKVFVVKTPGY